MHKFSANLGFLWADLPLVDAVYKAAEAGFDAVECHWPFEVPAIQLRAALTATGLPLLGINARCGDRQAGAFGLAAIPARAAEARDNIDEAIAYAVASGARAVHVLAGRSDHSPAADHCYRDNLVYAARAAAAHDIMILIEPINQSDVPDYHLSHVEAAVEIIEALGHANLKLMFDCYHVQIMQGDICRRLASYADHIGHVQIAAVPDRGEPDAGELFYPAVLAALRHSGYQGFIGAEYRPRGDIQLGLSWLSDFQNLAD